MRQDRKSGDDILKTLKAVQVQLKSYCMGMKELYIKKKNSNNDEEEQQLIDQMMATVGAAVTQMEPHIKAGTLWCPSAEGTPKQKKLVRR